MYSQATTTGALVTCTTRTPTGSGGLPQPTVIVARTACAWIVAVSVPSITVLRLAGFLSAASTTSSIPVGIRFRMCIQVIMVGLVVIYTVRQHKVVGGRIYQAIQTLHTL